MARRKMKKYRCPDGRVVNVYRDAEDAFPLLARDAHLSVGVAMGVLNEIEGKVGAEHVTQVRELGQRVDSLNLSMRDSLRATYIVFQSDPCSNGTHLAEQVRSITLYEQELRMFTHASESCVRLLNAGVPADEAIAVLREKLFEMSDPLPALTEGQIEEKLDDWELEA
ncbi:hypothetical protein [Ilumatobacter coccineus]|uniref:Uncharacterized protein n=1 Tax=Ilumatobacter coccineus (strain NBRC 103263 / KCTC 29153 / YM16-304) TaxID=1313172 RepID=A0A6C7E0N5_ILUCY|nr:hypothetical protein [Ilumatobacter coccineus]BAN00541.1 hypothetical protein YM304_02270 [Ilumatobacter coccineus YM16-304]